MLHLEDILKFNKEFVRQEKYKEYETSKFPNKKMAILSCMDTRLTELLPASLGIKNGDAKIIKNAGAIISHPYGSVMRSLLVCVYELAVTEILVIGHHDCGMQKLDVAKMTSKFLEQGISEATLKEINSEIDLNRWLSGFDDVKESVKQTVMMIKKHKLIPKTVSVYGFIMNPSTGELDSVD